jgi:hypothetical protein
MYAWRVVHAGAVMSLCKPLTLSPVPIEAKRRHAQKSSGPRRGQGKVQSCVIGRRDGGRSLLDRDLMPTLLDALRCAVEKALWTRIKLSRTTRTRVEATIFIKIKALRREVDKMSDNACA